MMRVSSIAPRKPQWSLASHVIRVLPGELAISSDGAGLSTILGSCISVCLFDPQTQIGGMNHFLLPGPVSSKKEVFKSAKYGAFAMPQLLNQMIEAGAEADNLIARVFGGGKVLPSMSSNSIGEANTQLALEFLQAQGIAVSSSDVLGECYRRIEFWPSTGAVYAKKVDIDALPRDVDEAV